MTTNNSYYRLWFLNILEVKNFSLTLYSLLYY